MVSSSIGEDVGSVSQTASCPSGDVATGGRERDVVETRDLGVQRLHLTDVELVEVGDQRDRTVGPGAVLVADEVVRRPRRAALRVGPASWGQVRMPSAGAPSASSTVSATRAHATGFFATVRTQRSRPAFGAAG